MNDDIDDGTERQLPDELRKAIKACKRAMPSESSLQRVRRFALSLDQKRRLSWRARGLWVSGLAAGIIICALVWMNPAGTTWAQVGGKLKELPWIHAKSKIVEGNFREFWYSPTRDVFAWRDSGSMKFDDSRLRVSYKFDLKDKILMRLPQPDGSQSEMNSLRSTFLSLTQNEMPNDWMSPYSDIVDKRRRRVVEDDKTWDEFEMVVKQVNSKQMARNVFRVDPATKLPVTLSITPFNDTKKQGETFVISIDYPNAGPIDIYDIGVPRDAKIDDRIPAGDLARIVAANKSGRDNFDSYSAIVVQSFSNTPWYSGQVRVVWRKGNRWRVEYVQPGNNLTDSAKNLPLDTDQAAWWKENLQKRQSFPSCVCDGKTVYYAKLVGPGDRVFRKTIWDEEQRRLTPGMGIESFLFFSQSGAALAELHAYPRLNVFSPDFSVEVKQNTDKQLADTILLELNAKQDAGPGAYHRERYWLDPSRGYCATQWCASDVTLPGDTGRKEHLDLYVMEKTERSPSGIWYPTVVRRKDSVEIDGKMTDQVYRFYLDFKANLPDSLFRPEDRKTD